MWQRPSSPLYAGNHRNTVPDYQAEKFYNLKVYMYAVYLSAFPAICYLPDQNTRYFKIHALGSWRVHETLILSEY